MDECVGLAALEEIVRTLSPCVGPALLARTPVELGGGKHRPGRAPHDLDRLVSCVLADAVVEAVGPLGGWFDEPGGHEDPALTGE
jgi:hypothetical protein